MENVVEQGCFLALFGDFNPAIFTPHWMAKQSILSDEEADEADVGVIHKELARFKAANLRFDVLSSRCLIFAEAEPFARAIDTVALLFLTALPHTPIRGIGLNYYVHADLGDAEKRMKFGRSVAPIAMWERAGMQLAPETADQKPGGVVDLTMQNPRDDGFEGFIQTTIQPSSRIQGDKGLFVQVTDHYGLTGDAPVVDLEQEADTKRVKKGRASTHQDAAAKATSVNYVDLLQRTFDKAFSRITAIATEIVAEAERA